MKDIIPTLQLNPFVPNAPFLYPLKTSENRKVQGGRERVHWERWVNQTHLTILEILKRFFNLLFWVLWV